ncbi:MAG: Hsp20/alpha crystallin family protein [Acidiferrobacterales bacterium]|jgi:HSP20 family protein|nr:Hsp20/alpha crystallin family protein [Acidiferrobacterales bacterium]
MREITRAPRSRRRGWLDDDFEQMFEGFFRPMRILEENNGGHDLIPSVDVSENDDHFTVHAEIPGVKKEDIHVTYENGVLTVSAETKSKTEEKEGERVIRQERRYGKYMRSLRLGADIDESKIKANYKDGVVEINLPKAEEVKPKRISVDVG